MAVSVVGPPTGSTVWRSGSCVPSFGVSPRLAFGAQPASVAVMTVGSAGKGYGPNGYPGAGIYLWANALDTSSSSRADASLQGAWTS